MFFNPSGQFLGMFHAFAIVYVSFLCIFSIGRIIEAIREKRELDALEAEWRAERLAGRTRQAYQLLQRRSIKIQGDTKFGAESKNI